MGIGTWHIVTTHIRKIKRIGMEAKVAYKILLRTLQKQRYNPKTVNGDHI